MITGARAVLGVMVLTIVAAGAGGWVGMRYGQSRADAPTSLNTLLHDQLDLTADQKRQLATIEAGYARQRRSLESEEQSANRELAAALLAHHQYGPQAAQAIDHFSTAMRALQQDTVIHVLAMRAILTPAQVKVFDQTVARALESGRP